MQRAGGHGRRAWPHCLKDAVGGSRSQRSTWSSPFARLGLARLACSQPHPPPALRHVAQLHAEVVKYILSDQLGRLPLFTKLNPDFTLELFPLLKPISFSPGDTIFTKGSPSRAIYFLLSGEIDVYRGTGAEAARSREITARSPRPPTRQPKPCAPSPAHLRLISDPIRSSPRMLSPGRTRPRLSRRPRGLLSDLTTDPPIRGRPDEPARYRLGGRVAHNTHDPRRKHRPRCTATRRRRSAAAVRAQGLECSPHRPPPRLSPLAPTAPPSCFQPSLPPPAYLSRPCSL